MSELEVQSDVEGDSVRKDLSDQGEEVHRTYSPGPEDEEKPDTAERESTVKDGVSDADDASRAYSPDEDMTEDADESERESVTKDESNDDAEEASPVPSPADDREDADESERESVAKDESKDDAEEASPVPSPADDREDADESERESVAKDESNDDAEEASPVPSPADDGEDADESKRESVAKDESNDDAEEASPVPSPADDREDADESERESVAKDESNDDAEEASPVPSPADDGEDADESKRESVAKDESNDDAEEASPVPSPADDREDADESERESVAKDESNDDAEEASPVPSPADDGEDADESKRESVAKDESKDDAEEASPVPSPADDGEDADESKRESVAKDESNDDAEEASPVLSPADGGEGDRRRSASEPDCGQNSGEAPSNNHELDCPKPADDNFKAIALRGDDNPVSGSTVDPASVSRHTQDVQHLFKPRMIPYKQPIRWDPVESHFVEDIGDELEINTARKPVFAAEEKSDAPRFKNGEPDYTGEYLSCFDEPNLLYRVYNRSEKTWAFYNDTCSYEMHVRFTFAKLSQLEVLGNTKMQTQETGEHIAEVIVYPRETEMFVRGNANGFTSKLKAVPLTENYYIRRQELANDKIQKEIAHIKSIVGDVTDSEKVLQACVENGIPFVDLEFPPCQECLATGAKKPFKRLPWVRPSQCLPDYMADQVRLFRGPVLPGHVDQGELGDSWIMCSIAALTEQPCRLVNMFRHPTNPELGKKERSVGGYRVTLNRNGQWCSVIVDDYLPMSGGRPKYAKSRFDMAEIWPCILEKAVAKVHRSYANICSGDPLHALQDMTGFPTSRFDDAFANASLSGKDDLFQDWVRYVKAQYQIILSTPGKSPKDKASGDSKIVKRYTSVGLLTGHAYVVLDAMFFSEHELRLVKLRNAWGRGSEWSGDWCVGDEKWERYPDVADKCGYTNDKNDGVFWMTWEACLRYFNGGGVCFTQNSVNDYRVPSTFVNCTPSCVLEISVEQPTWMCFTVSQRDKRGCPDAGDYHPVMISVAEPLEGGMYKVVQNSSADAYHPLNDKWTFYQARDISILYEMQPESSPYIVVPRLMQVDSRSDEVPYTLSFSCKRAVGHEGVSVQFRSIEKSNKVLHNFPRFEPALTPAEVKYQARVAQRPFPEVKVSSYVQ